MENIFKIDIDSKRIYGLDILRCLAILFVVLGHGNLILPPKISGYLNYLVFDGVSIFFVLSGFLIGGILIKEVEKKGVSLNVITNFWKRRWFRTLPNYFLILVILFIVQFEFKSYFDWIAMSKFFIFSQNLFTVHPTWFFPEAWSLSIEEWFYLMIPVIIWCLSFMFNLKGSKAIIFTAFCILLSITFFRYQRYLNCTVNNYKDWDLIFRKQVFTRLDSLMFGVIGAYVSYFYKIFWLKYKIPLFIAGIFLLTFPRLIPNKEYNTLFFCVFSFSINSLATLFLLPLLSDLKKGKGIIFTIVTYLSLISYSMYLLNLSVIQNWILDNSYLNNQSGYDSIILKFVLFWMLTILLSILVYKYYEVPMTKLRDRKKYVRPKSFKA